MEALRNLANSKVIHGVKNFLLVTAILLIVFDVILVKEESWPTISRVVLNAPPYLAASILIFGIAVSNVLFPRRYNISKKKKLTNMYVLIGVILVITIGGLALNSASEGVVCADLIESENDDFTEKSPGIFVNESWQFGFVGLSCVDVSRNYQRLTPCDSVNKNCKVVNTVSSELKLVLLIAGMILGYFLWPQRLKD